MSAVGGENYEITQGGNNYDYWEDGKHYIVTYVEHRYENQDMVLSHYPVMEPRIQIVATNLRIVLSDGSIFTNKSTTVEKKEQLRQDIDPEYIHGATVQVEYTIHIDNKSPYQINHLELICHLPTDYRFTLDQKLLTENKTNQENGWQYADKESMYNEGSIARSTYENEELSKREAAKLVLDRNTNHFYITGNGSYDAKIAVSIVVTDMESFETDSIAAVEVLGYKNNGNKRMFQMNNWFRNNSRLKGIFPGNGWEVDFDQVDDNQIVIIPPTGEKYIPIAYKLIPLTGVVIAVSISMLAITKRKKERR